MSIAGEILIADCRIFQMVGEVRMWLRNVVIEPANMRPHKLQKRTSTQHSAYRDIATVERIGLEPSRLPQLSNIVASRMYRRHLTQF